MNRALTFAAGAALTVIALRSRPGIFRIPIGLMGARMLADAVMGPGAGRRIVDGAEDEVYETAPGTELPAWW